PNRHHPDFLKSQLLNALFGGYFGSRLMSNIREDKGYTYGIHSFIQPHQQQSAWMVTTEAGRDVSRATIEETYKEMLALQKEPVSAEELSLIKNFMIGSLLGDVDGPFHIIERWKSYILNNMPPDYFYTSIQTIKDTTGEELQILAQKYPQTRVELYETVLGGGPSLLHSGAVGLYLGTQPVAGLPARRLDRLHLVPSAAKTHPLVLIDGVTEADLRAHRQIVIRDSAPSRMANGSWLSAEQRFTVDHLHTALGLIEAGMGFAWLPQTLVQSHPGLAMLTLAEPMTDEAPIHLVSQAAFAAGAAGAVLIEAITAQFAVNKAGSAPQNK
ncbi:MAG: hypothetical protein B7Y53_09135, partial [Halothiobacillus sp. 28-55-5]